MTETYREPQTVEEASALLRCRNKLQACVAEGFIQGFDIHGFVGNRPEISYSVDGRSTPRRLAISADWLWVVL